MDSDEYLEMTEEKVNSTLEKYKSDKDAVKHFFDNDENRVSSPESTIVLLLLLDKMDDSFLESYFKEVPLGEKIVYRSYGWLEAFIKLMEENDLQEEYSRIYYIVKDIINDITFRKNKVFNKK